MIAASEFGRLLAVARLAEELCTAVDLAEEDIGGARPMKDILGELGPAVDRVEPILKAHRVAVPVKDNSRG